MKIFETRYGGKTWTIEDGATVDVYAYLLACAVSLYYTLSLSNWNAVQCKQSTFFLDEQKYINYEMHENDFNIHDFYKVLL